MTKRFGLLLLILSAVLCTGCRKKEPPLIYVYSSETFWYVIQDEAAAFNSIYGFQTIVIPVRSQNSEKPDAMNVRIDGESPTHAVPVPWQSMPQRAIEHAKSGDPSPPIHADIDKEIDRIAETGLGDMFLTDSVKQTAKLQKSAISVGEFPICYLKLVLLVPKENPLKIKSVKEMLDAHQKLGIMEPTLDGLGEKSWELLHRLFPDNAASMPNDLIKRFDRQYDLLEALENNEIDAALAWDATSERSFLLVKYAEEYREAYRPLIKAAERKKKPKQIRLALQEINKVLLAEKSFAEAVPLTAVPGERMVEQVSLSALGTATDYGYCVRFADFLRSPAGQEILKNFGFTGNQ